MNIPNCLTVIRFLLIPAFIISFFNEYPKGMISASIFILAGLTDILDGFIARKYNRITRLGTVLDPLADKLMLISVLVCITLSNAVPLWIITFVIVKELAMVLGGISLYNIDDVVISANKLGKASTFLSYIAILSVLFHWTFAGILLYIYVAMAAAALLVYIHAFAAIKRRSKYDLIKK